MLQHHVAQERRPAAAVAVEGLGAQAVGDDQHQPLGRRTDQIGLRPQALDDRRLKVDDEYAGEEDKVHQHAVDEDVEHGGLFFFVRARMARAVQHATNGLRRVMFGVVASWAFGDAGA